MREGSENIPEGPPWTPQVWRDGPDVLVAQARQELFVDQQDLDTVLRTGAGPAGGGQAMAGAGTAPANESDQLISANPGPTTTVKGEWDTAMDDLKSTEPVDSWEGTGTGPQNPAP